MRILTALVVLAIFAVDVSLGSYSYYLGGSFGRTDVDTGISALTGTAQLDDEDTGYKLFAGVDLNEIFSVEAHYADLGESSLTGNSGDTYILDGTLFTFSGTAGVVVEGTSFGVSALARLPIEGRIKPFAKFGVHFWDLDAAFSSTFGSASLSDDGTDIFYGAGVEVMATDTLSARAEFERFDFGGDDVDFLSIGLIIRIK